MPLQELINQYEQMWVGGGGGGGDIPANSTKWKIICFNRVTPIWFIGSAAPAPPIPPSPIIGGMGSNGSLALPGLATLGIVTFGSGPVSLLGAFSNIIGRGEATNEVIFCTHELNAANDIIYIGDGTLMGESTSAVSLKGPNQIFRFQNMAGNNCIPLSNISLASSSVTAQCRVSVLVQ